MDDSNKKIAQLIHDRRTDLRMSLEEIAEACGVSKSTVSRWESGDIKTIKRGHIKILSEKLYIPIENILLDSNQLPLVSPDTILIQRRINKKVEKILNNDELSNIDLFIDTFVTRKK